MAKLDVGNAGDDLGEETSVRRVFRFLKQFRVFVAKRRFTHVAITDSPFARAVYKRRTILRAENREEAVRVKKYNVFYYCHNISQYINFFGGKLSCNTT